jgi:hypothetical protein
MQQFPVGSRTCSVPPQLPSNEYTGGGPYHKYEYTGKRSHTGSGTCTLYHSAIDDPRSRRTCSVRGYLRAAGPSRHPQQLGRVEHLTR